jgi:phospholipid/cholesterol/gamma-HCH transport system ATP-binding protein
MRHFEPTPYTWPVEVRQLVARYGDHVVLDGIDFTAPEGEISVILGRSGCGKSTLLKNALGLIAPSKGTVRLLGVDIATISDKALKDLRSDIGVLFQNGALFTSMTVGENVSMVIREIMDLPEDIIAQMVHMKLSLVGLEDAIDRYPDELSGGMRKRVAIARAIAADPKILFCDEPSAGLDPVVASEIDDLLLNLKTLFNMTLVVVTHELASIRKIADRVVMIDAGKIMAEGSFEDMVNMSNQTVSDFFGRVSHTTEKARESIYAISREESS